MLTLVLGGSGSGKSEYAENLVINFPARERIYLATMIPGDEESRKRIERHRKMRESKGFSTIEQYTGLSKVFVPKYAEVLLECISNLLANEMFSKEGAGDRAAEACFNGILHLRERASDVVIVSNEVFSDGKRYDTETMRYLDALSLLNQEIAALAEQVVEVVCSIPIVHKQTGGRNR